MGKERLRTVIRDELKDITGSDRKAVILNQMIFWSSKYFGLTEWDRDGWIWKTGDRLAKDCLLSVTGERAVQIAKEIVEQGLLQHKMMLRHSPDPWKQRTMHHWRVNLQTVYDSLDAGGWNLRKVFEGRDKFSLWHEYLDKRDGKGDFT